MKKVRQIQGWRVIADFMDYAHLITEVGNLERDIDIACSNMILTVRFSLIMKCSAIIANVNRGIPDNVLVL